eukprot:11220970-Lingulodinium_polyedra.AAC.1
MSGATEERGRMSVPKYSKFIAGKQQRRVFTFKQARLLQEERVAESKRRGQKGKGKGGGAEGADER